MTNYIHPTAMIGDNVRLGKNNYIGPYCVIGYPAEHKGKWSKEHGPVIIGDNNIFTGLLTIDGGTDEATVIGSGVMMMKHSHVGHDALIQDGAVISCGAKIGGHATVGERANIGLNAAVHQRTVIAPDCMIGMGAVITKKTNTQPNGVYVGNPAKYLRDNK